MSSTSTTPPPTLVPASGGARSVVPRRGPHVPRHAATRPSSTLHRVRRVVTVLLAIVVAVGAVSEGTLFYARWQLSRIPTFTAAPVGGGSTGGGAAAPPAPLSLPAAFNGVTTFLLFTTGSRGMTAEEAKRYNIPDVEKRGEDSLTDSIILAVLDAPQRRLSLLSIPRDTWIASRGSRINEIFVTSGPQALADEVTSLTGIPVNHMVSISFVAAARLADTVDGIDIEIPTPMRDSKSHLDIPFAGCVHLDGRNALAFARSRHTQVQVDGRWQTDASASDFGRSTRQQAVITAALGKLLTPKLPILLPRLGDTAAATLQIDAGLDMGTVFDTARVLATGTKLKVVHLGLTSTIGQVGKASVVFSEPHASAKVLAGLISEVPGAEWPSWIPDSDREAALAPAAPTQSTAPDASPSPSGSPETGTDTSVVGSDTPISVKGFDTGKHTDYRPCSNGQTP